MSKTPTEPDEKSLDHWLENLDLPTGNGGNTARLALSLHKFEQIIPGSEPHFVPVPEPYLERLIKKTHDEFREALPDRYLHLRELESSLAARVDSFAQSARELQSRIDKATARMDEFRSLSEAVDTLGELPHEEPPDGLNSALQYYPEKVDVDNFEDLPVFMSDPEQFGAGVSDWTCFIGSDSPLRVAALARINRKSLREQYRPVYRAFAVGELRLQILRHVLQRFEITGVTPSPISDEDAKATAESIRKTAKGGRPPKVADGRDPSERRPIIVELLYDKENWHWDSNHIGSPKWGKIADLAFDRDPGLFHGNPKSYPDTHRFGISDTRIKQLVNNKWDIDLEGIRRELDDA